MEKKVESKDKKTWLKYEEGLTKIIFTEYCFHGSFKKKLVDKLLLKAMKIQDDQIYFVFRNVEADSELKWYLVELKAKNNSAGERNHYTIDRKDLAFGILKRRGNIK